MKKVLHLDDEPQNLEFLVELFKCKGIELVLCPDAETFKTELFRDIDNVGAVILDVLNATLETTDHDKCYALAMQHHLPVFTYSGQHSVLKNDFYRNTLDRLYTKGDMAQMRNLVNDITATVNSKERNRLAIAGLYPKLYSFLEELQSQQAIDTATSFFRSFNFEEDRDLRPELNDLRMIYEPLFFYLRDRGLLPEECFKSKNNKIVLSDVLRYLKGEVTENIAGPKTVFGVIDEEGPILPPDLAKELELIISIANETSHAAIKETADSDILPQTAGEYMKQAHFLTLCSILAYCVTYAGKHPDKEQNLERCYRLSERIKTGSRAQTDENGNLFLDKCLVGQPLQNNWNKYRLVRNTAPDTNGKYPFFLKIKEA